MKAKLLLLFLLSGLFGYSQHPSNYLYRATREATIASMPDSGIHVPAFDRGRYPNGIAARAGLLIVDSTGGGRGLYYSPGSGILIRLRDTTEVGGITKNGIRTSGDSILLGDSLDRYTYMQVLSTLQEGGRYNQLRLGNRPVAQSLNGNITSPLYKSTYGPSLFYVEQLFSTQNNDIDSSFYNAAGVFLTRTLRDSTDAEFKIGGRTEYAGNGGIYSLNQYFPPRDSNLVRVGRDGQSMNSGFFQLDIGNYYGYKLNTISATDLPDFPISNVRSSVDLVRSIDNTRTKKMYGVGITGYNAMYKSYQTPITMATYQAGNYWERTIDYTAYGDAYSEISGATKAYTLGVAEVNKSIGFYSRPHYLYTNTVRDGYGFVARGDSDYNHLGWLNIGPYSTLPTRDNGGNNSWADRLYVTGNIRATGNTYAFVTQAYGMAVTIPKSLADESALTFGQTDTTAITGIVGGYHTTSRDSRALYIRSEGLSGATYASTGTGFRIQFETGPNHANVSYVWRNGNWTFGNGATAIAKRLYKKGAFDGGVWIGDTLTLNNAPTGAAAGDTTNFKPLVIASNGDVFKGAWSGSGGGGGGSGLTVGTTTIASGTNTKVLFNNSGILGEYTISGSGNVAMTTSPVFTTPDIGTPSAGTLTNATGYLWHNIASPASTQSLSWPDGVLNSWTNGSNTETFHTVDNNSLTTGISYKWNTSSITTGNLLSLNSTSTAANGFSLLNINSSGANANSSRTAKGAIISVTNTGTTSENRALELTASGATTNWAAYATAGNFRTVGAAGYYALNSAGTGGGSITYDNGTIFTLGTTGGVRLDLEAASSTILARRPFIVGIGIDFGNNVALDVYKSASGTSNIQNWRSSGGGILANVDQSGILNLGLAGSTIGKFTQSGNTSGTITFQPQAAAGTYNMNWPITAGTSGQALISGGGGSTAMTWLDLAGAGTNPTITGVANVASSSSPVIQYTRAGNRVDLSGYANITPTAGTTLTIFRVSLPITSNFISATEAPGTCTATDGTTFTPGNVTADATNDELKVSFTSINTSSHTVTFSATYVIQ